MLKTQANHHHFRLNTKTREKDILRKMGFKFKTLSPTFFFKIAFYTLLVKKNRNAVELRDQGGHSETSKSGWIRWHASIP